MMARWHEKLFPALEELGIGFVAFSPLANGFLSAKYNKNSTFDNTLDYRSNMPQFTEKGVEQNCALLDLIAKIACEKNATSAQISLAWMMCKKPYMDMMKTNFVDKGIPVIIGEYGTSTKNKTPEMIRKYLSSVCEAGYTRGMCPVLWDITDVFYKRNEGKFIDPELLKDLMDVKNLERK